MITAVHLVRVATVAIFIAGTLLLTPIRGHAQAIDHANDFLPTYIGPQNGDLDVLSTGATFDGTNFRFTATLNGTVGATTGAFYVWGVDRGAGTVGFPTLAPGVRFDTVLIVRPVGTNPANAAGNVGANTLAPGSISFTANSLSVLVPSTFLPNNGKTFSDYTINLWPRFGGTFNGINVTGNPAISDFAPNNSNVQVVTTAPEPGSLILTILGGVGLAAGISRRRS
jgi:hypothetical protein